MDILLRQNTISDELVDESHSNWESGLKSTTQPNGVSNILRTDSINFTLTAFGIRFQHPPGRLGLDNKLKNVPLSVINFNPI